MHGAARVVPGGPRRAAGVGGPDRRRRRRAGPPGDPGAVFAIGQFYADFTPATDDEVAACLQAPPPPACSPTAAAVSRHSPRTATSPPS